MSDHSADIQSDASKKLVNLGCGHRFHDEWINLDLQRTLTEGSQVGYRKRPPIRRRRKLMLSTIRMFWSTWSRRWLARCCGNAFAC